MALNIKGRDADALAGKLAGVTGESLTSAVRRALEECLEREFRRREKAALAETWLIIGKRCAQRVESGARSLDYGSVLYDGLGLPK